MTDMDIDAAIIERARNGEDLTEAELLALDGADLLALGMLADEVRRARVGDRVGFARVYKVDRAIQDRGRSCGPGCRSGDSALGGRGYFRTDHRFDSTGACGHRCRASPTGFSLGAIAAREWGDLPAVLTAFRSAGLDALAEAPVDLVTPAEVETAAASGVTPQTLSVQRWSGDGRIPVLLRARAIASANPPITRFSPLSREQSVTAPTTGYHDVRMVALARLALPALPTIDVDWQQVRTKTRPGRADVRCQPPRSRLTRRRPDPRLATRQRRRGASQHCCGGLHACRSRRSGMRPARLGAVSYLNTTPLVRGLDARPDLFTVRFDVPSLCASLLHAGSVDVGLIPAVEYLSGDSPRSCRTSPSDPTGLSYLSPSSRECQSAKYRRSRSTPARGHRRR